MAIEAIEDRYVIDALLRKTINAPLSDFALIELADVLKGIKKANQILSGEPDSPEDWFAEHANG